MTVGGDIEAKMIEAEGKIVCNTLKCENIKGDVTVNNENTENGRRASRFPYFSLRLKKSLYLNPRLRKINR